MKKFAPIIAAVLLIGGYFGYTKFMAGGGPKESPAQAQATQRTKDAADKKERLKAPIDGHVIGIGDPFVITLPDTSAAHFAKVTVSLKVDAGSPLAAAAAHGAAAAASLEEQPEIRDIVIRVIGSHPYADLLDVEKREAVKAELKQDITRETAHTIVLAVYFTDFALQ